MKSKKGAEITLNTIIIATIAIIVLIILIGIFTGKIRLFGEGLSTAEQSAQKKICTNQNGYCSNECDLSEKVLKAPAGGWTDCPTQKCCTAQ